MKFKNPFILVTLVITLGLAATDTLSNSSQAVSRSVSYSNPVIPSDFPDPFVLRVNDTYYVYATNSGGANIQIAVSKDLANWESLSDAMPQLPGWVTGGFTWAPEVAIVPGGYALYYTARHAESSRQCIGVAFSKEPTGPFFDDSSQPMICQLSEGGSIDASPFTDTDGQRYLYWKNDGNCCGQLTYLYAQRLNSDGLKLEGAAVRLIHNTELWEGNLVEAPTMWRRGNKYYLFFSAADYGNGTYATGYAYGNSPMGPFTKWKNNPILETTDEVVGPGHQCVFTDPSGRPWFGYHAWTKGAVGYPAGQRTFRIDPLEFRTDGVPVVRPSTGKKTVPAKK